VQGSSIYIWREYFLVVILLCVGIVSKHPQTVRLSRHPTNPNPTDLKMFMVDYNPKVFNFGWIEHLKSKGVFGLHFHFLKTVFIFWKLFSFSKDYNSENMFGLTSYFLFLGNKNTENLWYIDFLSFLYF